MSNSTDPSKIEVDLNTLKSDKKSNGSSTTKAVKLTSLYENTISLSLEISEKMDKSNESKEDK